MEDTTIIIEETFSEMISDDTFLSEEEDTIVIENDGSEAGSGEVGQIFEDYNPIVVDGHNNFYSDEFSIDEQENIKQEVLKAISDLGLETGSGDTFNVFNVSIDDNNLYSADDEQVGIVESLEQDNSDEDTSLELEEEDIEESISESAYSIDDIYLKVETIESTLTELRDNQVIQSNNNEIQLSYVITGIFVLVGGLAIGAVFSHIRP